MERELKMLAGAEVDLEGIERAVDGLSAGPPTALCLTAHYYDTPSLRLARAGMTLRHRSGEGAGTWTLKLPGASSGSTLARTEVDVVGSPRAVPAELRLLVSAQVRHEQLARVATVVTDRTERPLLLDGAIVASVTDDRVRVRGPRRGQPGFREIEVELAPQATDGLLEPIERWLREQGCEPERPPLPKLVRVLGDPATAPPEFAVPLIGKKASVGDLVAAAIASSAAQLVAHHPGVVVGADPEDVHRFRVGTRRLRSDLRTFRRWLDRDWLRPVRTELAWLADHAGTVRDLDVLGLRLDAQLERLDAADALALSPVVADVARQRSDAHLALRAVLGGERYLTLLDTLIAAVATPPLAADVDGRSPARRAVRSAVWRPWKELATAADAITPVSPDHVLHATRILAKRARYASEAVTPLFGADARALARRIADLQEVLGDHQDTVVAEAWLRSAARDWPEARLALGQLIGFERVERERLRGEVEHAWAAARRAKLRTWLDR